MTVRALQRRRTTTTTTTMATSLPAAAATTRTRVSAPLADAVATTTATTAATAAVAMTAELVDDYFVRLRRLDATHSRRKRRSSSSNAYSDDDDDDEVIGPRGITQLCADCGVDAASCDAMVLLWRLGATRAGCVSRGEWQRALHLHRVTTCLQLKPQLRVWTREVAASATLWADMYDFLYDYLRGERDRLMSCRRAVRAWRVFFAQHSLCDAWCDWATTHLGGGEAGGGGGGGGQGAITRDVWQQVRELMMLLSPHSTPADVVSAYTASAHARPWSTVIDDFVASLRAPQTPPR